MEDERNWTWEGGVDKNERRREKMRSKEEQEMEENGDTTSIRSVS